MLTGVEMLCSVYRRRRMALSCARHTDRMPPCAAGGLIEEWQTMNDEHETAGHDRNPANARRREDPASTVPRNRDAMIHELRPRLFSSPIYPTPPVEGGSVRLPPPPSHNGSYASGPGWRGWSWWPCWSARRSPSPFPWAR